MGGFVPGLSAAMGAGEARDLGVKATEADRATAIERLASVQVKDGQATVDQTFTEAELSALLAYQEGPLESAQVRLHEGGGIEISALVQKSQLDLSQLPAGPAAQAAKLLPDRVPVYVRGTLALQTAQQVNLTVEKLEVGRLPLPTSVLGPDMQAMLNESINRQLATVPGLRIETVTFTEGAIHVKATAGK